jgi:hypothetical protein
MSESKPIDLATAVIAEGQRALDELRRQEPDYDHALRLLENAAHNALATVFAIRELQDRDGGVMNPRVTVQTAIEIELPGCEPLPVGAIVKGSAVEGGVLLHAFEYAGLQRTAWLGPRVVIPNESLIFARV